MERSRKLHVISDHHFEHANIILYCNRPFEDVDEMNEKLIEYWNQIVGEEDIVIHLGDFCLGSSSQAADVIRRLNGSIVLLWVPWHHDKWAADVGVTSPLYYLLTTKKLSLLGPMHILQYNDMTCHLSHYPLRSWEAQHYGTVHIHGHSHGKYPQPLGGGLVFDAGVDACNFAPVRFEWIYKEWSKREQIDGLWQWSQF